MSSPWECSQTGWGKTVRSERIAGADSCGLQRRWAIDATLADRLITLQETAAKKFSAAGLPWDSLFIISGYRSPARQLEVNPSNPNSKHSRCPAVAVDLRVSDLPASTTPEIVWYKLGQIWIELGGRWGGVFNPPDLNHFENL